ncbi:hypothetical protein OC835_004566 [Tilletia horrida]|nr:hypothetical protein OC835_004566 [Tilletia horrida]KAK0563958.1 hypothetical protein OC844_001954 [Tilletia horrida]
MATTSRPSFTTSWAKQPKTCTHLAITGDAVLGPAQSLNNVHNVETTIYDVDESPCAGSLNIWLRETPAQGLYILSNVPCATKPLRIAVPEPIMARMVPPGMDGSGSMSDILAAMPALFSGNAVIYEVSEDKKSGKLTGLVYVSKSEGWVPFWLNLYFEDSPKWVAWHLPPPRTLVTFDALLWRMAEDGTPECLVRRITAIDNANKALLDALNLNTPNTGGDRAAKLKELRAAAKRTQVEPVSGGASTSCATPSVGETLPEPSAAKPTKTGIPMMPPSSPTPGLQTRKRGRVD